jgi:hypothetical protein
MGNLLIISFFIVGLQEPCGTPSLFGSGSIGLCLVRLRNFWHAGGRAVVPGALSFGRWSRSVLCGVFGVREILGVSRTPRGLSRIFSTSLCTPFSLGQRAGWPRGRSVFLSFFPSFPLPPSPLYTPCVLRVAPLLRFLLIYSSDLSKKNFLKCRRILYSDYHLWLRFNLYLA